MAKPKFEYEVIEAQDDSNFSKILKKNVEVEFTMAELHEHEGQVSRIQTEMATKLEMEQAAMTNVEENHGEVVALVKDMEPLKQHALFLWLRSKATVLEIEPKLKEIDEALEAHQEEVKDIKEQINWVAPDVSVLEKKDK